MFVCLHACSQDFQKGGLHGCVHASIVHNFKAYKTGGGGGGGGLGACSPREFLKF